MVVALQSFEVVGIVHAGKDVQNGVPIVVTNQLATWAKIWLCRKRTPERRNHCCEPSWVPEEINTSVLEPIAGQRPNESNLNFLDAAPRVVLESIADQCLNELNLNF